MLLLDLGRRGSHLLVVGWCELYRLFPAMFAYAVVIFRTPCLRLIFPISTDRVFEEFAGGLRNARTVETGELDVTVTELSREKAWILVVSNFNGIFESKYFHFETETEINYLNASSKWLIPRPCNLRARYSVLSSGNAFPTRLESSVSSNP